MADRYGYVRDSSGNRLFPVTHINLILGKDAKPIDKAFYEIDNKLINAQTYEDLLNVDTTEFPYGAIGYVITEETYYSYSSNGWKVMTTFVSQNIGAGRADRVRQGVRHANIIVTVITTVLIVLCYSFARPVFEWVTSTKDPAIVDSAVMYAKISILFFYVLGPLFVFRCSLQGMGRKVVPLISSITEMLVKILSAMFLVPAFAYKGVAFTEPISWVLMTIILATAYMTGNPEKYVKSDEIVE